MVGTSCASATDAKALAASSARNNDTVHRKIPLVIRARFAPLLTIGTTAAAKSARCKDSTIAHPDGRRLNTADSR